ncbi:zinc transporter ZIP11 isoform X4 [Choloepus didactylus]|uniref:zinc transporter ZIP11 isoform X4 n=1 Tax=Choloepus didactylus TaxID=27675 RepID=UPI00189F6D0F|nr:zinc transporter ZIP11 isoform X4 [Choloepus didactylus]
MTLAVSSMLQGHSSVFQALLGTFFTWGMTAAGAALVFVFSSGQRRILDGSLGFAAGVMLAASYWSLLAPAVEMAVSSGGFGAFAFFPVAVGFTLGAAFVYVADLLMPHLGVAEDPQTALALNLDPMLMKKSDAEGPVALFPESELSIRIGRAGLLSDKSENGEAYQRRRVVAAGLPEGLAHPLSSPESLARPGGPGWRRIALLILAITIHNIPEGLAVGVGFGAVEKTASATFESARVLSGRKAALKAWQRPTDRLMQHGPQQPAGAGGERMMDSTTVARRRAVMCQNLLESPREAEPSPRRSASPADSAPVLLSPFLRLKCHLSTSVLEGNGNLIG